MNAIASLKLQSFNSNRARRNPLTANTKCCSDNSRRRTKRFINFYFSAGRAGATLYISSLSIAAAGIAGAIGAGFGLGAALIATNIGNVWKTGTSSSQIVQAGTASPVLRMGGSSGNNGQHHYYYYFPPSYYYYYYYHYG